MIRGIRFQVPNEYGKILYKILENIDIDKLYWYNIESQDQVFAYSDKEFIFETDVYTGEEFKKIIMMDSYYAIFAKVQAYFSKTGIYECKSYEEFSESDCRIVIFIVDAIFVDVYAKDRDTLEIIKASAENNKFSEIEYITEENDRCFIENF